MPNSIKPVSDEGFSYKLSKTYKVMTGCGNVYITADFTDKGLHKIYMQRTSKLHCSPTVLNPLFRSSTFQSRRDIKQAIEDNKATFDPKTGVFEHCDKFSISVKSVKDKGELWAYSCADALGRCLEIILKENGSAIPSKEL
jgi:hypothetical protein